MDLVSWFRSSLDHDWLAGSVVDAEPLDGGEDVVGRLGPSEGFGIGVVLIDEGGDVGFQVGDAAMDAAAYLLVGDQGEEPLDLVEPGRAGRGQVDVPAGPLGEPGTDHRGLVGGVVVHDQVDIEVLGHVGLDLVEELEELRCPVAGEALADHLAGGDVQGGEQRGCAVALVVVAAARGLAGPHGQQRLGAVQRLDLALLVDAQHDGALGREA